AHGAQAARARGVAPLAQAAARRLSAVGAEAAAGGVAGADAAQPLAAHRLTRVTGLVAKGVARGLDPREREALLGELIADGRLHLAPRLGAGLRHEAADADLARERAALGEVALEVFLHGDRALVAIAG